MKDDEHVKEGEESETFDEEVEAPDDKPGPEQLRRTERGGFPQLLVPTWERKI